MKAKAGGARILPVIVNACRFSREKKLSEYQAVNDPKKPLATLAPAETESVFAAVAEAVEEALGKDANRLDHTEGVVLPDLSLQAMGLLRLLARSKTGQLIVASEDQFVVDSVLFHPADTKFFHDDITSLVSSNLVTVDHSSRGDLIVRVSRGGAKVASMLPPPTEEEPHFVLPE
jgi:hypothetical protein